MNQPTVFKQYWLGPTLVMAVFAVGGASLAADEDWLEPVEGGVCPRAGKSKKVWEYEFSRLGNFVRTAQRTLDSDQTAHSVANDAYFFVVGENARGEPADLLDLGETAQFNFSNVNRRKAVRTLLATATGPLGNYGFPLESPLAVLKHNAPRLRGKETTLAGRNMLLLEGDFERFTDSATMSEEDRRAYSAPNSRIFLDPALDYRIVRWETKLVHEGKTYLYTDTYEYDHAVDGYPLLSKYVSQVGAPVAYSTQEIEFSDWRLNENKPGEFRLSHFGLKEPDYGAKPLLSGWMWLLLIGASLVIVGGWLYRRSSSSAN